MPRAYFTPAQRSVGAPTVAAPDGTVNFEHQGTLTGPCVGVWLRVGGAWVSQLGKAPLVTMTRAAAMDIPTGVETLVNWTQARENDYAMWDVAHPSRIVFPVAGLYDLKVRTAIAPNVNGTRWSMLYLNGWTPPATGGTVGTGQLLDVHQGNASALSSTTPFRGKLNITRRFAAGDYIEVTTWQNSGAAMVGGLIKEDQLSPELVVRMVGA